MPYDGTILSRARTELEKIRQRNEAEQVRRRKEACEKIQGLDIIGAQMRRQMLQVMRLTLSGDAGQQAKIEELRRDNLELQAEQAEMLVEAGYPIDYLEDIYSCSICRDSGTVNGKPCQCLQKIYNRLLTEDLSPLMRHGDESFENFDLTYYPAEYDFSLGATPREFMRSVLDSCRSYAERFPEKCPSLLLQGSTGLGKTYLSACIARVVSKKGFSVCYDTAVSAFEAFEKQKFSRDQEETDQNAARVRRMENCDLMILDDLGTELVTSMTVSALYTLINTRLKNGKATIISTNCSDEELRNRYSPQICSRLLGDYRKIPFFGKDIRFLRRER